MLCLYAKNIWCKKGDKPYRNCAALPFLHPYIRAVLVDNDNDNNIDTDIDFRKVQYETVQAAFRLYIDNFRQSLRLAIYSLDMPFVSDVLNGNLDEHIDREAARKSSRDDDDYKPFKPLEYSEQTKTWWNYYYTHQLLLEKQIQNHTL